MSRIFLKSRKKICDGKKLLVFLLSFKREQKPWLRHYRAHRVLNFFDASSIIYSPNEISNSPVAIISNCALRYYLTYRFRKSKFKVQFNQARNHSFLPGFIRAMASYSSRNRLSPPPFSPPQTALVRTGRGPPRGFVESQVPKTCPPCLAPFRDEPPCRKRT